jgi:hypothetical protein
MRAVPFASHGLLRLPSPADPVGQSCCTSGSALALALGNAATLVEIAGADGVADAPASPALVGWSFEHPHVHAARMMPVNARCLVIANRMAAHTTEHRWRETDQG